MQKSPVTSSLIQGSVEQRVEEINEEQGDLSVSGFIGLEGVPSRVSSCELVSLVQ